MTEMRHTTFTFTLKANAHERIVLAKHAGAARFAYNQGLRLVIEKLEANSKAKERGERVKVPWTRFDLINAFNSWKLSPQAGEPGAPGLAWRSEICSQAFEEAQVDLGKALKGFSDSRSGKRKGKKVGFPTFKKKATSRKSFRLRNKQSGSRPAVRLGDAGPLSLTLPKIGCLKVRESTRKLRRVLKGGRILFATIFRDSHHWKVRLNCEAKELVFDRSHTHRAPVGIDRGLSTFAVVATADASMVQAINGPKPLGRRLNKLRRYSRAVSRKRKGGANRAKAVRRLSRLHARIRHIRCDFIHRSSTSLIKNHDRLLLEDLHVAGMLQNSRLSRHIADSGWSEFARCLQYKASWYGASVGLVDRFAPSTKRCSRCGANGPKIPLEQRTFYCLTCGACADRDVNAAANLAQWPYPNAVAAKQSETLNALQVCEPLWPEGFQSTDETARPGGTSSSRRPRRTVPEVSL